MMYHNLKHEFLLYLINQPQLLIFAEAIRGFKCLDLPKVGYLINDAHLATEILMHPNFSSGGRGGMGSLITPFVGDYGLFNMDGEKHIQFKRQMMKAFNREYVRQSIDIAAQQMLSQLQAELCAGQTVDLVAFTRQFTTRVMLYMFGVDIERLDIADVEPKITTAVNQFMSMLHLTKIALTEKESASVFKLIAEVDALIDENQRPDQSDSLLQSMRDMGLSEKETHGLMYSLLVAGTETTNVSLPRVLALLLDSGQYQDLKENPALMSNAIEEGIRVTTASPMIPRAIEADTKLGDYEFKAGRRALLIVYNIMKQDYDLANARSFDIRRKIPQVLKHLNFGHGAHFCLGLPLAHGEIEITLKALLDLPKTPSVVSRSYSRGQTFPAYTKLSIRF
jgi:cytochrome P450